MADTAVDDAALPALERALDGEAMHATLMRATSSPRPGDIYRAQILRHKPGRRCAIRYIPIDASGKARRDSRTIIGKLYRSRRRAARMYQRQIELETSTFPETSRTRLPAALLFVEELGLVLQAHVDGIDLRDFLVEGAGIAPLELAGLWLARLHGSEVPANLKAMSTAGRVARMKGWLDDTEAHLPKSVALRLAAGLARSGPLIESAANSARQVVIHKDFYYANLIWDGLRIWGLDLDELSLGDPAFDVGHFLAHLERHAWRSGAGIEGAVAPGRAFLRSYEDSAGGGARERIPFYKAYTFVKLAATEVERRRENWLNAASTLAKFACNELDAYASP